MEGVEGASWLWEVLLASQAFSWSPAEEVEWGDLDVLMEAWPVP